MVKIGVIGFEERVNEILLLLNETEGIQLSTSFNVDQLQKEDNLNQQAGILSLIDQSDALYILPLQQNPFELIQLAFRQGKHVFIEQISMCSVEELEKLLNNRKEANVKCLTGSYELSHPSFIALQQLQPNPVLIESIRQVKYDDPRILLPMMDEIIKDLNVIMHLIPSEIKRISASGLKIMNDQFDVVNVRLHFANGSVAVMSINKHAESNRSEYQLFEEGHIYSLDLETGSYSSLQKSLSSNHKSERQTFVSATHNPHHYQLINFRDSILGVADPMFKLREGYKKIEIAAKIIKKINSYNEE